MPLRQLSKIFSPRSVVVIEGGFEQDAVGRHATSNMGLTVIENLSLSQYPGLTYRVNPSRSETTTLRRGFDFSSVVDLPTTPDLAVICTAAENVSQTIQECGQKGILGVVVMSTGFRELGTLEGRDVEEFVRKTAKIYPKMTIIGPNSMGVISPWDSLNASHADEGTIIKKGTVAFISQSGRLQSGRLCGAILDWAERKNVGFSHFVSVGNMMDVDMADLIDYFASDRHTQSLILYIESVSKNAREFVSAARSFSRKKPIIAFKAGRFSPDLSFCDICSHSGAIATSDMVHMAAFNRAGIVRVMDLEDMFDCVELLSKQKSPLSGKRVGIITNTAGPAVVAVDALMSRNGVLAELSEKTTTTLRELLPSKSVNLNPLDVLGDATPGAYASALKVIVADREVDVVIAIFAPQAGVDPTDVARAVISAAQQARKPLLTTWMGGRKVEGGIKLFNNAGIPTYATPEHAVRALMYLVSYSRTREVLYETPRDMHVNKHAVDPDKARSIFERCARQGSNYILDERDSKLLLDAYGVPTNRVMIASTPDDAVRKANKIGYPVALKAYSPQIDYSTCIDGVALILANDEDVVSAFSIVAQNARKRYPGAEVIGVTVERLANDPRGIQLLLGAKYDPVFGMVMLAGMGGVGAEFYNDVALELPPLNERLARKMLESLRLWPLLKGFSGRPPVNVDKLVEILIRLSYLIADFQEIRELDVNPLLVTYDEVVALDARIVTHPESSNVASRLPYSNLAIRPYPEEFIRPTALKDGTRVLLRPIRPEDEPMWHEMLALCSQETIMFRFFMLFNNTTHEMATRYCFIDYDREMAIVAEIQEACGRRRLIGVGRLVSDADRMEAEYAVLVQDEFQGKGLGSILTDYCMEICQRWGIRFVIAETSPSNRKMIQLFAHRGFSLIQTGEDEIVIARKDLA